MKIRVAGIAKESVVDGPGIRSVVFAQGCPRRCIGCHNPDALEATGGEDIEVNNLVEMLVSNPLIRGVSFSGGDPFMQAAGFSELALKLKQRGLNILTFTGYTWEELLETAEGSADFKLLIQLSDIIIDGPFEEDKKDLNLAFRGSSNQRVIDVQKSLAAGQVIEVTFGSY